MAAEILAHTANSKAASRWLRVLKSIISPNGSVTVLQEHVLTMFWIVVAVTFWATVKIPFVPQPPAVAGALQDLWWNHGLSQELIASLKLNITALVYSTILSLVLSYLSVVPLFRPVVMFVTRGRFLGLVGLFVFFLLAFGSGYTLKLMLLVFGETVFFVTSMVDEIARLSKEDFDHARTQGMSEWRVVYEVVVLGTFSTALDIMRQNAAIGWTMLTMVEGISRSEGGIGALLLNENKHFKLESVMAIQLVILATGIVQDIAIKWLRNVVCPYVRLTLERR